MNKYGVDFDSMSYIWTVWVYYVCELLDSELSIICWKTKNTTI